MATTTKRNSSSSSIGIGTHMRATNGKIHRNNNNIHDDDDDDQDKVYR